jgi:hypothetical protein
MSSYNPCSSAWPMCEQMSSWEVLVLQAGPVTVNVRHDRRPEHDIVENHQHDRRHGALEQVPPPPMRPYQTASPPSIVRA